MQWLRSKYTSTDRGIHWNIIDAVTNNKATIKLPKGIAKALDVAFTEEPLPEELLDKLKNLHISEGT